VGDACGPLATYTAAFNQSNTFQQQAPGFCNTANGTENQVGAMSNGNCDAKVITTCSDQTNVDAGSNGPLTVGTAVVMSTDTTDNKITGSLTITMTDELTMAVVCTGSYQFTATLVQ
jgi:hypothetical protein